MAKDKSAQSVTMMVLLPSYSGNSSHIGNDSIDVVLRGCFGCFDTIACARNGVISGLVIITAVLCFVRAFRLHLTRHPVLHQYIIFYCATLECILCAVHWLLGHHAQFDFVMQYLKLVQFLLVSHLYWTMATRVLRKEALTHRLLLLLFLVSLIYFTVVASLGIIHIQPSWIECLQPYWLALSSVEFLLVQLFMVSGVYITRRLNEISTLDSLRRAQKRDLWILIVFFEMSALVSFVYDVTLMIIGDEELGCSGVFLHMQELYSPIFGLFMVVKFLVPIWTMLFVFQPIEMVPDQEDLLPAISEDGNCTSVFSPPYEQQRNHYKAMHYPTVTTPDVAESPTLPGQLRRSASNLTPINEEISDINYGYDIRNSNRPVMV